MIDIGIKEANPQGIIMRALIAGDIHGIIEKFERVLKFLSGEIDIGELMLLTGDFESLSCLKKAFKIALSLGLKPISIYGNHEDIALRDIVSPYEIVEINSGYLLGLGALIEVDGIKILGISGNRGSGRKWTHWRDSDILEIIKTYKKEEIDVVLSHEMPFGYADKCRNRRCGKPILNQLIRELNPIFFFGGHLHSKPDYAISDNGTIVIQVGAISNKWNENISYFTLVDLDRISFTIFEFNHSENNFSVYATYKKSNS